MTEWSKIMEDIASGRWALPSGSGSRRHTAARVPRLCASPATGTQSSDPSLWHRVRAARLSPLPGWCALLTETGTPDCALRKPVTVRQRGQRGVALPSELGSFNGIPGKSWVRKSVADTKQKAKRLPRGVAINRTALNARAPPCCCQKVAGPGVP